jgi:GntR family transcriptional repressor for pyruvate dehydrogenase complex
MSDLYPPVLKRVEYVVEALQRHISDNQLKPGDRLPPERVFLEQLGVSRSSLREAVRVLSTLGAVDVRHGDGMFVGAGHDPAVGTPMFDPTEVHALRNLVETRLGIELAAVTAAVDRASDEDLERLQQLVEEDERRLADDPDYAWEPLGFELALIEMSGNTWLYELELMLRDAWLQLSGGLRANVGRYGEWLNEHRAILASIRSRNVAQAQRLVMAHLSLERFEEDLRSPGKHRTKGRNRQ